MAARNRLLRLIVLAVLLCGGLAGAVQPAAAVIHPTFTPVELVKTSRAICLVEVKTTGNQVRFQPQQTLHGSADLLPGAAVLPDGLRPDWPVGPQVGLLFLLNGKADDHHVVLHLAGVWREVHRQGDDYRLAPDGRELQGVWHGDTRMLAHAVRWCLAEPRADFPTAAGITWQKELPVVATLPAPIQAAQALFEPDARRASLWALGPHSSRLLPLTPAAAVGTSTTNGSPADEITGDGPHFCWLDFDQDGRLDLLLASQQSLRLQQRDQAGAWQATDPLPSPQPILALAAWQGGPAAAAIVATAAGWSQAVYRQEKLQLLPLAPRAQLLQGDCRLLVADLTGDGLADLVELSDQGLQFLQGQPDQQFAPPVEIAPETAAASFRAGDLQAGDFNNDGALDLLLVQEQRLRLLTNDGRGRFRELTTGTGDAATAAKVQAAVVLDWNFDGRQDLAVLLDAEEATSLSPGEEPRPDVTSAQRQARFYFNRGFFSFADAPELARDVPAGEPSWQRLAAGDFLGEGMPAIALLGSTGRVQLLQREASTGLRLGVSLAGGSSPAVVTAASGKRSIGAFLVRPGETAFIATPAKGPLAFSWQHQGKVQSLRVLVLRPGVQAVLSR
ncbi:FG-GAP repeat domain-containing protein [Lignipirellula cremea]|uniref:FG-GAP repeat protein n=1 Tax=Lignipirellula cremea TaxID=2528010 RepID=A0A518DPG4_9BACT|nr:VCBS repeat-containing protein [Lignipirellula cremea]QDU93728.1 FG-GAP repeat protein [Lignipirellula cremea]